MEGTSVHHMLGLTPRVQERPVNFFGQAKTLPTFGALIVAFSMGELRETGGAWQSQLRLLPQAAATQTECTMHKDSPGVSAGAE